MGLIPESVKQAMANQEPREERKPKAVRPDGKYIVTIVDATPGVSQAGNPKVGLTLKFDDVDAQYWDTIKDANALVLTDKAAWKVAQVLEAFGLPADVDLDGLLNARAEIVVGRRTYEKDGEVKETNEVKFYNPLSTNAPAASAPVAPLF